MTDEEIRRDALIMVSWLYNLMEATNRRTQDYRDERGLAMHAARRFITDLSEAANQSACSPPGSSDE